MATASTLRPEFTTRARQEVEAAFAVLLEALQVARDADAASESTADGAVAYLLSAARLVHEAEELLAAREEVRAW